MQTTQQAFHVMRGNVADGCQIAMDNGDIAFLKGTMNGWQLFIDGRPYSTPTWSAYVMQGIVVKYPEVWQ